MRGRLCPRPSHHGHAQYAPAGILLKLRVEHDGRWMKTGGKDEENVVRASIKADLEALAGG